ncbi:uncharacterized protein PITG_13261 [Phytophthora infestans T30-4]|uniref:Uncharacterized protein n=1 Tax=Phytophthora infestans (strain T30-4) TaxID=403677 RepID=D0NLJ5_PHYIT|nr:uncharacterized protein PITG_13261 [Phytophthora infestans T30-4]EEY60542.1 hypothetical protein PITG_13261 [Phytophthora infestans T30-4]|eukprot:XP_002899915.1 hypothetical protein PITG_13261 [Phytophthora infestans T30-4]
MKRSTPQERLWENGLRQGARACNGSAVMSSSLASRSLKVRRPTIETKRSENSATSTPLIAATALQAYLANDIDAKSRIPRLRPAFGPTGEQPSRPDTIPNERCNDRLGERQEGVEVLKLDAPPDNNIENAAAVHGIAVSRAESPLSSFQKHTKAASKIRSKDFSEPDALGRGLQRSIHPSFLEVSRSNPPQARPDAAQSTVAFLNNSPPAPHAKPVKPMIPQLSSSPSPTLEAKDTSGKPLREAKETAARINDVIVATNAILSIQRMWRSRRKPKDGRAVVLIIDKSCDVNVTPLFHAENARCERATNQKLQESVRRGNSVDQGELVWKRPHQIIQRLEAQRLSMVEKTRRKREHRQKCPALLVPSAGPDIGAEKLKAETLSVRAASTVTSQGHPKTIQKSILQRQCKLPRVFRLKRTNTTKKLVLRATRGPSKAQKLLGQDQQASRACDQHGHAVPSRLISKEEAGVYDRFMVFPGAALTSNNMDTKHSRNDLISVGELALARSLLYDKQQCQATINEVEHLNDLIPLTSAVPSIHVSRSGKLSEILPEQPEAMRGSALVAEIYPTERNGDGYAYGSSATERESLEDNERSGQEPRESSRCKNSWEKLHVRVGSCRTRSDDCASYTPSPSSGSFNFIKPCEAEKAADVLPQHCSTDLVFSLNSSKSSVTKTVLQTHRQYRDQHDDTCNQQTEAAPSSQYPIPVAQLSQPRLDEEKRDEFLRVLNDFKRCLRPPPPYSSNVLHSSTSAEYGLHTHGSPILHETTESLTLPTVNADSDL